MTDKEKQIEEMVKVLHDRIVNQTWRADKVAKELYEIAVPKDSVVLSKEVFEDYMRDARQVEEGAEVCYNCHNEYAEKIDQARKETAREILQVIEKAKENGQIYYNDSFMITAKKAYGVEVEE